MKGSRGNQFRIIPSSALAWVWSGLEGAAARVQGRLTLACVPLLPRFFPSKLDGKLDRLLVELLLMID